MKFPTLAHRHLIVPSTFLLTFLTMGTASGNSAVYFGYWIDEFGEERSLTSSVGACNIGLLLLFGPIVSMLTNRFGHRPVMLAGTLISTLSMFVSAFASSVHILLATHIGIGTGWCCVFVPGAMAPTYYWPDKYHGAVIGVTISGIGMGQFVAPILVEYLVEHYSWRGALIIQSGINLHLLLCSALIFPVKGMKKSSDFLQLSLLKNWIFINYLIYNVLGHIGISVMMVQIAYVGEINLGLSKREGAMIASTIGIVGTFGRLFHGCISKLPRVNVLLQHMVSLLLLGILILLTPFVNSYALMLFFAGMMGFFSAVQCVNFIITIFIVGMDSRTAGFGFFALACGIGMLSGAPISGVISDVTNGNFDLSMYIVGSIVIFSTFSMTGALLKWRTHVMKRYTEEELQREHQLGAINITEDES